MSKSPLSSARSDTTPIMTMIAIPVIVGVVIGALVLKLLWRDLSGVWLPLPSGNLFEHASFWFSGLLSLITHGGVGVSRWQAYTGWIAGLTPAALRYALYVRVAIASLTSIASAAGVFYLLLRQHAEHGPTRGRPLVLGKRAVRLLAAEAKAECVGSQVGINVHPDIQINTDRETKHFLVMGASGSGKTQIIWQMLSEAIRRGDRVLIFDSKGEFTEELKFFQLIAPWDKRSHAWHIAADCLTLLDARELAMRLIPDNDKDPLWPNASRQVLVALIVHLQTIRPGEWTFADLHKLLLEPIAAIRQIASVHNPDAVHSLEEGSRTTQSIMINLMAFMAPVSDLAKAWGNPEQKRFSMRQWILDTKPRSKTVVMQGHQRYQQLARSYCNGLLSVLASVIASPELAQDSNRRIWLFLDEFPQLGRARDIGPLIEMGRSKGLRIVIGAQDVAQLYDAYGKNQADAWTSSMATSFYTRLEGGSTTEWVSRRIGDKEDLETNHSVTHTTGATSKTEQTHARMTRTVMPAELKTLLGKRPDGVDVLIDGFDRAAYVIRFPFHNPNKRRAAVSEAAWVKPVSIALEQPTAQAVCSVSRESLPLPEPSTDRRGQSDHAPDTVACESDLPPPVSLAEVTARAVASGTPKRWKKRSKSGSAS